MVGQSATRPSRLDWRLLLAVYVFAVGLAVIPVLFSAVPAPLFTDTDDAMRMVVVHDWLAGQGWYDHVQHRLNTPWGAEIHWSRLVDLPLGGLILLFGLFTDTTGASYAAGFIWPLLLLGVLLWLCAGLALRLVGSQGVLPALILPVLSPALISEFAPGRVDHHNLIIILTLALTWSCVEAVTKPRLAIVAGLLAATAMAIATESIPLVAAAIGAFGLIWILEPARARSTGWFGSALAVGSIAHLMLAQPPSRWLEPACDMISSFYVSGTVLAGGSLALVSLMAPPRSRWLRVLLLGVAGGLSLAAVLAAYPQCLDGPYAGLDPWLLANWIDNIAEAKSWPSYLLDAPPFTLATGLPVLLALVAATLHIWRIRKDRLQWSMLLLFSLFNAMVMLAQIRGARLALASAIPAAAWVIAMAQQNVRLKRTVRSGILLTTSWLGSAGTVLALVIAGLSSLLPNAPSADDTITADKLQCLVPSSFTELAALPSQRVMTPIDLGSHLLLNTHHQTVSAPYHRNQRGLLDTFTFFNHPISEARSILIERGISLVVVCPAMPELKGLPDAAPGSFVRLAARAELPAWLRDVSGTGPLKIYEVLAP